MSRTLIKGGCVVTMDPQARDLPQGDVLIENGRIAAIGPALDHPKHINPILGLSVSSHRFDLFIPSITHRLLS